MLKLRKLEKKKICIMLECAVLLAVRSPTREMGLSLALYDRTWDGLWSGDDHLKGGGRMWRSFLKSAFLYDGQSYLGLDLPVLAGGKD